MTEDPVSAETRRGRPRSAASHQAVLTATARLLTCGEYEYDDVTVERIAAEAGVGKQTIYRWWTNKAGVVLEAVLTGHLRLDFSPVPETGDLRADLLAWVSETLDETFTEGHRSMARSLISALVTGGAETDSLLAASQIWEESPVADRLRAERDAGRCGLIWSQCGSRGTGEPAGAAPHHQRPPAGLVGPFAGRHRPRRGLGPLSRTPADRREPSSAPSCCDSPHGWPLCALWAFMRRLVPFILEVLTRVTHVVPSCPPLHGDGTHPWQDSSTGSVSSPPDAPRRSSPPGSRCWRSP
ncbi:TetR/AcrR family transcriptional regulator [Nesterenkonia sp. PF2B19]|uniref:TetR/AcrR family transcriptional regulator n=1 Tax=Nesterenkonia sp. PF2B19 TaxID=1881858 RepID=UPI0014839621|nr:TetR/AcrR family transcriptional regulator [Nesterenkonia sp. PF2B19]